MRTLFDGQIFVSYSQAFVESDRDIIADYDLATAFAGQANGLLGAGQPGQLWLVTGMNIGSVPVTVEAHEAEPATDDAWEEVVEASFVPGPDAVLLVEWGGMRCWPLELGGDAAYRVRYSASGMDAAHASSARSADDPEVDRYLLQFWPAPVAPDRVIKQTSRQAAYWHTVPAGLGSPG